GPRAGPGRKSAHGRKSGQQGTRDGRRPDRPHGAPQNGPPVREAPDGKRTFRAATDPFQSKPATPESALGRWRGDGIFIEGRVLVGCDGLDADRDYRRLRPRRRLRAGRGAGEVPHDPARGPERSSAGGAPCRRTGGLPAATWQGPSDPAAQIEPPCEPLGAQGNRGEPRMRPRDSLRLALHRRQLRPRHRRRTPDVRGDPQDAARERRAHPDRRRQGAGAPSMSTLIKDVDVDGRATHVYIEGNRIAEIGKRREADTVLDGRGKIALPGLVNLHTHAAMTLFRS